ncbi:bifunctional dTDP-4-dehydrorhamnose 3,5-epimerase/dTDP-4-dehydrorhamnose reductase [Ditylenchus destructor]|uniref:Bifunctional dTDP-4-dehydrorhamnose 3,5-epimerase/dTDP-4-dehydrorhamnose reductase n=1 Tax=Ditylenchus destructor TaxID=166010 RepID=A0AAD4NKU2_9BILA|nr:bifunctional dTDP-4-dehydrorhamnose 3,5-epimerase/dTDP-4-dehydrorhamnose reductase [Ditylenchus destructor]
MNASNSVLLVCQGFRNPALNAFLTNISDHYSAYRICFLCQPNPNEVLPAIFTSKSSNIKIFYGSSGNSALITKIVADEKIATVINFVNEIEEPRQSDGDISIVPTARNTLITLTNFLEALRTCENPNIKLIQVFTYSDYQDFPLTDGQFAPIYPHSLNAAQFSSIFALLHAYTKSYKMDIQVAKLSGSAFNADAFNFLCGLITANEERKGVKISTFKSNPDVELSEFKKSQESAARLLVYGGNNWVGKIFVQLLANSGIEYVHGSRIPGLDTDDSVYEEVVLNHPSHVVFLLQHLDAQTAALNPYVQAGSGPTNLLHNTRNNLYAPWTLANMCQKAGIHFTYVGTHCIHTQSAVNSTQVIGEAANGDSPNNLEHWNGENRFSLTKKFSDQSLSSFSNSLRARIQLPFNEEQVEQNWLYQLSIGKDVSSLSDDQYYSVTDLSTCLPVLLKLILNQDIGDVNLVNPCPLQLKEIIKIARGENDQGSNGKIHSPSETKTKDPAHSSFVFDTSRIEQYGLKPTESSIRTVIERLKNV